MRTEIGQKRVRAFVGGVLAADADPVTLVWEHDHFPVYGFAGARLRRDLLAGPDAVRQVGDDLYVVRWDAADAWFEEDEEVYVHPRSPYTRIDILESSRHVVVTIAGVTVAESTRPKVLFETGLPARFYVPKVDVRTDLLRPSRTVTRCPYKGSAAHWSAQVDDVTYDDVAWTYHTPLAEAARIASLVAFYPNRVELVVDGERRS